MCHALNADRIGKPKKTGPLDEHKPFRIFEPF